MNAPAFLPAVLSTLMILVAGYAVWRLLAAPALRLRTDRETDALLLLAGTAGAGLISRWAHSLPRPAWSALFVLAACYFAVRSVISRADPHSRGRLAAYSIASLVLVYMFQAGVAPSTLHGSTAGEYTMAGMPGMSVDTTITYPAIGLACVAAMASYAAGELSRASAPPAGAPTRKTVAGARGVQVCKVVVALTLAYAILSKLV